MIFEYPLVHFENTADKIFIKCSCPECEIEKTLEQNGKSRERLAIDIFEAVVNQKINRRKGLSTNGRRSTLLMAKRGSGDFSATKKQEEASKVMKCRQYSSTQQWKAISEAVIQGRKGCIFEAIDKHFAQT